MTTLLYAWSIGLENLLSSNTAVGTVHGLRDVNVTLIYSHMHGLRDVDVTSIYSHMHAPLERVYVYLQVRTSSVPAAQST